jgi:hypothetical protein
VIMFAVPGAKIDRRRRVLAFPTAPARQKFRKARIATLFRQQAHRQDGRAPAAMQFEPALRPVGQAMRQVEGRRMHGCTVGLEHNANKRIARGSAADPD